MPLPMSADTYIRLGYFVFPFEKNKTKNDAMCRSAVVALVVGMHVPSTGISTSSRGVNREAWVYLLGGLSLTIQATPGIASVRTTAALASRTF